MIRRSSRLLAGPPWFAIMFVVFVVSVTAIASAVAIVRSFASTSAAPTGSTTWAVTEPSTTTSSAPAETSTTSAPDPHDVLAPLAIDDHPDGSGYKRDLFMPGGRWQDPDHNGCDARKDALRAQSIPPVTSPKCSTTGGRWSLVYVPGETTSTSEVDADHVVPLANAWRSGARRWGPDQLVRYAADQAVLWIVDDGANQAKGDRGPEAWRPPVEAVWCTYARRWVGIKVAYGLTATTAERDALGQMLERCQP